MDENQIIEKVLPSESPDYVPSRKRPSEDEGRQAISSKASSELGEPQSDAAIRRLWTCMADIYGHRWVSAYGENPQASAGKMWAKGLRGLSQQQLARGLEAAVVSADPWPPTLPAFRALCLSIPTFAAVKAEIRKPGDECSPFAVLVWRSLDRWHFARSEQDKADRMLRDAYDAAREHVMRGGELPQPEFRIAHEAGIRPPPAPPEVAEMHLARMAEVLGACEEPAEPSAEESAAA